MAGVDGVNGVNGDARESELKFDLTSANAFVFHTPFSKLVQKSLGRLLLNDFTTEKVRSLRPAGWAHSRLIKSRFIIY